MVTLSTVQAGSLEGNYQLQRPAISLSRVAGVQRLGWDTPYSPASLDKFREKWRRGNRASSYGSGSCLAVSLSTELFATKAARAAEVPL